MYDKPRQSGNIFFALFGAVAMVGVLGAAVSTILKGPVAGMQRVTKYTVAENNMIAAGKLALIAATNQPLSGDCDGDDMVEPIPFSTTGDGPFPAGGGYLPAEIGATRQDPWGNIYGYCVWDHGIDPDDPTDNDGECGGSTNFRKGANSEQYIALAVISSGPDRVFQSSCRDFDPDNPEIPLVVKSAGSDDVVLAYTYAEAGSMSGGLWKLKSGDSSTAEVGNRNVEIAGSGGAGDTARIGYDEGLNMSGVGEFLAVKTDHLFARTADGDISVESPLRVQKVMSMEKPMGVAGEGIGTKSVIAPALRRQVPTMPIAPDGQDWADAIVCPGDTAVRGGVYTLQWYAGGNAGNDQVVYRYEYHGSVDYHVFYNHNTGARGTNAGAGGLPTDTCPANYNNAIKIYYGGGGGGNVPSILPGWPDAIKCPRTGNSGENIYYLMHAGAGVQDQVWYSLAGSSNNNWNVIFKKSTRTYEAADGVNMGTLVSNASRHCLNASTTIDMLVEDGRGIFFGGGSGGTAGLSQGQNPPSASMVPGWPDAITCQFTHNTTNDKHYVALYYDGGFYDATSRHYYSRNLIRASGQAQSLRVVYNSDGSYHTIEYAPSAYSIDCAQNSLSISELYSAGQAFNFVDSGGPQSAMAPAIRQQLPSMPLAPDGKDWADAIVCPSTHGAAYTFRLVLYYPDGGGNNHVYYRYMTPGSQDYGVYYHHTTGARGSAEGAGVLPATACPANYNDTIKVYYGAGGGASTGHNFLPGWPDVISCEFSGAPYDGEELFFYPAGINGGGQYAYLTQVSTGGERFRLVYGADKSFVSFVELPGNTPRTGSCHNKSIPELYAAGLAFDFGGGGGGTGGGSGVGSTITASIPANQDISGACIYPGTGTLTIPEAGHYFIRGHASGYKYSGNAVDITLFLEKSDGGHVFAASGGIPSTSNSYFYANVSDIVFFEAGTYTLKAQTTNGSACNTTALSRLFGGHVWATKLSGGSGGGGGDSVWSTSGSNVYRASGNVGIGTSNPNFVSGGAVGLHLADAHSPAIRWEEAGSNNYFLGVDGGHMYLRPTSLGTDDYLTIRSNGNVGIGKVTPEVKLDVAGAVRSTDGSVISVASHSAGGTLQLINPSKGASGTASRWVLYNMRAPEYRNALEFWAYDDAGCVPGGKCASILQLHDNGDMILSSGQAYKPGGGAWTATSDARLKNLDGVYEQGLDSIVRLKPVRFHYKEGNPRKEPSDKKFVGLVAQDVQPIFPEAVSEDDKGYLALDSTPISYAVINAIKELKALFDGLAAKLGELVAEIAGLKQADEALSQEIVKLRADNDNLRADNDNLRSNNERLRNDLVDVRARLDKLEAAQ